jgi:cytochrome c
VNVSDQEDGSLENKRIAASKVKIVAAYQDAEDKPKTDLGHQEAPVTSQRKNAHREKRLQGLPFSG